MDKKTKIIYIVSFLAGVFVTSQIIQILGSEGALMEKYPDIHPDDIKAAHRKMYRAALKGDFKHVDTDDDEMMEHIFFSYVNNL